jgi:hypothetical protein
VYSTNTNNDSNSNKWYTGGVLGFIIFLVGNYFVTNKSLIFSTCLWSSLHVYVRSKSVWRNENENGIGNEIWCKKTVLETSS